MDVWSGPDRERVLADRRRVGEGLAGMCVLDLPSRRALQTCVPRGCDLVLVGVAGAARLDRGVVLHPGRLVVWPRGVPITVQGLSEDAQVCVVAVPAGAEQVLAALSRGDLPAGTIVALAADSGVELLLP